MSRTPPARTPAQQKEHERRLCLATLDVAAMRAWAFAYGVALLGDDRTVLISMHETRVLDKQTPAALVKESIVYLQAEYPDSAALAQIARHRAEFRGRRYSKASV
jgi:hypothetical protein